jgi:hypothetical protein
MGEPNPAGYAANNDDCDDIDLNINPAALEICDDLDNDCNGIVDDDDILLFEVYYPDLDEDGYGSFASSETDCEIPEGFVTDPSDCDDDNPGINPGAPEICDGFDTNCDGLIDNEASGSKTWYLDEDGDGYGTDDSLLTTCDTPGADYVQDQGGDCDDDAEGTFSFQVNPGAVEICDGIDNNCDGGIDTDVQPPEGVEYSIDADGDSFGNPDTIVRDCEQPSGYIEHTADDCDDGNETIGECAECGCQTTSPQVPYSLVLLIGGLLMVRRRNRQE